MEIFALIKPDEKIRHGLLTQLQTRVNYLPEDSWGDSCCTQQCGFMQCFLHLKPFADGMQGDLAADREGAHAA